MILGYISNEDYNYLRILDLVVLENIVQSRTSFKILDVLFLKRTEATTLCKLSVYFIMHNNLFLVCNKYRQDYKL